MEEACRENNKINMTICYFGDFDPEYSRNKIVMKGLRENGATVITCSSRSSGFRKILGLIRNHRSVAGKYDVLVVGYSDSRIIVPLAWLLSRKRIVWDAFYSVYDTWVNDRKYVSKYSPRALYLWVLEWMNCRLADIILLEAWAHVEYFSDFFGVPKKKFIRVLVGADNNVFHPAEQSKDNPNEFLVHFHGKFIPLQGVQYIINAAKILEGFADIKFDIIGIGQTYKESVSLAKFLGLKNVNFIDKILHDKLFGYVSKGDICLGIFGDSDKTARVIPNKVYTAIAMAKPVLTADTPAIRELFSDRQDVLLCRRSDAKDLAEKILELRNNKKLRDQIAEGGYDIYTKHCTPVKIGSKLLQDLKSFMV